jgi:hypothetical protein
MFEKVIFSEEMVKGLDPAQVHNCAKIWLTIDGKEYRLTSVAGSLFISTNGNFEIMSVSSNGLYIKDIL